MDNILTHNTSEEFKKLLEHAGHDLKLVGMDDDLEDAAGDDAISIRIDCVDPDCNYGEILVIDDFRA